MVAIGNGIGVPFLKGGGGAAPNPDFISTWDTTQAGSASDTVVLPLLSGGTYSGTIDWGDGNTSALSYANRTHVYASSGIYTITISGSDIQGFQFNNTGDKNKIIDVSNWGNLTLTAQRAFGGCANLDISATDAPNITTTSFFLMFDGCTSMTTPDLNSWDVSSVTNFYRCFGFCNANPKIENWDMSSATKTEVMFQSNAGFNRNIGGWNFTNLQNCAGMFLNATAFNNGGSSSIDNWNVSTVTVLNKNNLGMFQGASSFNQPVGSWDITSATDLQRFFQNATSFNQNLNTWDLSSATSVFLMFAGASSYDQSMSTWDISGISGSWLNFCNSGALSTANYDATLIGWEATLQAAYPSGVGYPYTPAPSFGTTQYTLGGAAEAARTSLISTFGWTITDGGGV